MDEDGILVLGIGNLLWADEGFGVRAVQALHQEWRFPQRVTLMDGGTQGLGLLPHVQAASRLIVFDAIDCGLPPATLKVLTCKEVPRFLGARKLSLHQTGFQEILALAELAGELPEEIIVIGVQPVCLDDYGGGLHPAVQALLPTALEIAVGNLMRWGCEPERRSAHDAAESGAAGAERVEASCASFANAVFSHPRHA
jgi:hydrogenase maturation protease